MDNYQHWEYTNQQQTSNFEPENDTWKTKYVSFSLKIIKNTKSP